MIRAVSILTLCSLLAACQGLAPQPVHDLHRLAAVKTIYIGDLGKEEGADLIEASTMVRERIETGLAQSGRFSIVRSPEEADAILAGVAGIERWYHGMEGFYGLEGDLDTHHLGVGRLRLIDTHTQQVIWTHTYKGGFLKLHQSVSSRVADQVTEKLLADVTLAGTQPSSNK
jgi:hypothetical protein